METTKMPAALQALQYQKRFADLENFLHEFENITCSFGSSCPKESAMEFARRVFKNKNLSRALHRTKENRIKIILDRLQFAVYEATVYINMEATDDEIITFLWGDTLDKQTS